MTAELRPAPLAEASRQLGIDPFELVRLMVAAGHRPQLLELTGIDLVRIAEFAGIERWWDEAADPPKDDKPRRGLVRATVDEILSRRFVDTGRTKKDNLGRGRTEAETQLVEEAIDVLIEQGLLVVEPHVRGTRVSVDETAVERLERFVAGDADIDALQRLWN